MGLAIEVGILADLTEHDPEGAETFRNQFALLNEFLSARGMQPHVEPLTCEVWSSAMYGYSGLHYLRRLAAHLDLAGQLPTPGGPKASEDPVLTDYYRWFGRAEPTWSARLFGNVRKRTFDHLILHGDAEGYYLPVDFPGVLFPSSNIAIAGGAVGSSVRLLAECRRLANALDLPVQLDPEDAQVWEASENQGKSDVRWQRYGVESFTCLRLIHAATHSLQTGAAIVFC